MTQKHYNNLIDKLLDELYTELSTVLPDYEACSMGLVMHRRKKNEHGLPEGLPSKTQYNTFWSGNKCYYLGVWREDDYKGDPKQYAKLNITLSDMSNPSEYYSTSDLCYGNTPSHFIDLIKMVDHDLSLDHYDSFKDEMKEVIKAEINRYISNCGDNQ